MNWYTRAWWSLPAFFATFFSTLTICCDNACGSFTARGDEFVKCGFVQGCRKAILSAISRSALVNGLAAAVSDQTMPKAPPRTSVITRQIGRDFDAVVTLFTTLTIAAVLTRWVEFWIA